MTTKEVNQIQLDDAFGVVQALTAEVNRAVVIEPDTLRAVVGGVAINGAILFAGDPGIGKTATAVSLAGAMGGDFGRIQGNADTTPSDIVGSQIWNPKTGEFEFVEGPLFNNVVLVDELNRIPPKGQAGLLQGMQERQVTPNGTTDTYVLPKPFTVVATHNVNEVGQGTYVLTKAGLDRFDLAIDEANLTPDQKKQHELAILARDLKPKYNVEAVVTPGDIEDLQAAIKLIEVPTSLRSDIVDLSSTILSDERVSKDETQLSGARKNSQIAKLAQYLALTKGRQNVEVVDIHDAAPYVLTHRVGLTYEAQEGGHTADKVVKDAIDLIEDRLA